MSRSYKLPIFKDKGFKKIYNRIIKRNARNYLKTNFLKINEDFDYNVPNPKTIINDYTYSDYKLDFRYRKDQKYWYNRFSRK